MKVFVAGATGALGRQLVPMLVQRWHEVVGMTRTESKHSLLASLGARPVVADALDPEAVGRAVSQAEPRRLPRWLVRLAVGEAGAVLLTEARGASNAKAERELGWRPRYPSWRLGFVKGLE